MLQTVTIDGFRCLEQFTINTMKRLNIFIGPNNSGKSSIIEALFLHACPLNFGAFLTLLNERDGGFAPHPQYLLEKIKWCFSAQEKDLESTLTTSSRWNENRRETHFIFKAPQNPPPFSGAALEGYPIKGSGVNKHVVQQAGMVLGELTARFSIDKQKLGEASLSFINGRDIMISPPPIGPDMPAVYISPYTFHRPGIGLDEYSETIKSKKKKLVVELLQYFDKDIDDIEIVNSSPGIPELHIIHNKLGTAPLSVFGDGLRRTVHMALCISSLTQGILLIDEIEGALHYSALKHFIEWIDTVSQKYHIQVIATTHSLDCLDALIECTTSHEDLMLYKIHKDEEGRRSCEGIDGAQLAMVRNTFGLDVRG